MKSFHNLCRVTGWSVVGLALSLGGGGQQGRAQTITPFCNPHLNVFVQCEDGATPGGTVSFFCNVLNNGNRPITNVVVQDSQGGAVTNVALLPVGGSIPIFANYIPDPCGTVTDTFTAVGIVICPPSNNVVVVSNSATSACSTPCPFDSSCQIQLASLSRAFTNCVPAGATVFASVIIGDEVGGDCSISVQGSIVTNVSVSSRTNFVGSFTCVDGGTNTIIATVTCVGLDGNDFIRAVCTNQFVCCSAEPGLEVTKEITCMGLLGGSTCPGGKTATGAATDTQCPSFCYTVVLKNTGNVPLHNNTVVDSVVGALNFPLALLPGQVVTGGFLAAHCSNVVNTVTATAFTPEGLPIQASDSAAAQIVQASLTCDAILTSTNDVDGDLSGNDHHVSLPVGPLFDVQVGVTLTAGDVDVVVTNVFIGFYDSYCYITNFISLSAHTSTNLSGCSFLHRCFSVYSTNIYVQASGYVNPAGGICSLDEDGSDIQVSTECSAVLECVPGCPTCEMDDNGNLSTVVVDQNVSVNFNTKPPTYSGDPDLLPYFTFDTNGPTADTWKAIFDVGSKKLLVKSGATITTKQVPLTSNNRRAPGLVIKSTCALETEPGSYITVGSLNRQAGDILIQVDGDITINGVVSNSVDGTRGRPGNITIASDCGSITTGGGSRIITYGQDFGGSDINIASCEHGDIVIDGLVDASYKSDVPSTIRIAAFDGSVVIVGTNKFGTEVVAGTKRTITSGLSVRSRRDPIPGAILIQAADTINVFGSTLLSKNYPNYGAVAVKTMSNSSRGGLIDARALTGRILGFDRAFDDANRFNTSAKISLQAGDEIKLKVSASINDGASDNTKAVVSTQAGDTGKGGTNLLRAGFIIVDAKAQVLADFSGRPGAAGANIISGCTSVSLPAGGEVSPPDDPSDNVGTCGGPDPLFLDCSELGVNFGQ